MNSRRRLNLIRRCARELAWSGQFEDNQAIEEALISAGYSDAPAAIRNPRMQGRLAFICKEARLPRLGQDRAPGYR